MDTRATDCANSATTFDSVNGSGWSLQLRWSPVCKTEWLDLLFILVGLHLEASGRSKAPDIRSPSALGVVTTVLRRRFEPPNLFAGLTVCLRKLTSSLATRGMSCLLAVSRRPRSIES